MNLKKLLAAVGLLTVSVPATLSVVACGNKQTDNNTDEVIKSINKITNLEINITSEQENKKVFDILNDSNIGLATTIANHKDTNKNFQKNLFKLDTKNVATDKDGKNKVTPNDILVSNETYYFKYTYNGKPTTIFVPAKIVNKELPIINGINKIEYAISTIVNSKAVDLEKTITADFIKNQLSENLQILFNKDSFTFQQINNEKKIKLSDEDLKTKKEIKGTIVYSYGTIKNQETKLTIKVDHNETEQKIADTISKTSYITEIPSKSAVNQVKSQITPEFIKSKLNDDLKNKFKNDSFKLNQIIKDNKDLTNDDLTKSGIINAQINFNYGTTTNQITNLTITVTISQDEITDTINNSSYSLDIFSNSKVEQLKGKIDGDFIKKQLSSKIQEKFNNKSFKLVQITKDNKDLTDDDLTKSGTINAQINYTYDNSAIQNTKLKINIQVSATEIINAINNISYSIKNVGNTTVDTIKNTINGKFIKDKLDTNLQAEFKEERFNLTNITKKDGTPLTNQDLNQIGIIETEFSYIYDEITSLNNNLTITINNSESI